MKIIEVEVDGQVTSTTYLAHVPRKNWGLTFEVDGHHVTVAISNVDLHDINGVDIWTGDE